MVSRRIVQVTVAGATLIAGLGYAVPATASLRYDPVAKTGFAGAADVRKAFGWSEAKLAARADGLVFGHDFWTRDTYSVRCGQAPFPVAHQREFGRFDLTDVVVRAGRPGGPTGYDRQPVPTGFRITGPYAGISGTSVAPAVGQPCPQPRGPKITRADLVATTTGWSLTVSSGAVSKILRTGK
ncbi:hypothetical protein AB0M54_23795 [Actinoplanes sp. NPDC051470]|uniref:hypothetical protein n=1 Tax=unclassified Actinoplanes TaxID=2626549 RepID=UPI00341B64E9